MVATRVVIGTEPAPQSACATSTSSHSRPSRPWRSAATVACVIIASVVTTAVFDQVAPSSPDSDSTILPWPGVPNSYTFTAQSMVRIQ